MDQKKYFQQIGLKTQKDNLHKISKELQQKNDHFHSKITNGAINLQSNSSKNGTKKKNCSGINISQFVISQILNQSSIKHGKQNHSMSPEEHKKFIKEITKQSKKIQKMRMERMKHEQQQALKKKQQEENKKKNEMMEKMTKKQMEIQQKLKIFEQIRQKSKKEREINQRELIKVLSSKTLHEKLQQKFHQTQAYTLQQKKEKLAQIRQLHKPITLDEINKHKAKVKQLKQKYYEGKSINQEIHSPKQTKIFKSHWYKEVKEAQNEQIKNKLNMEKSMEQNIQKVKNYKDYIKTHFKPEIDMKKVQQLKNLNTSVKIPELKGDQPKILGRQYLRQLREKQHIIKKIYKTQSIDPIRYPNYLSDLKKQRKAQDFQNVIQHISKKEGLSEKEKKMQILNYANRLQQKAKYKHQMAKVRKQIDNQSDEMLLKAIQAKLSVLK